jgi:hypothetical protein
MAKKKLKKETIKVPVGKLSPRPSGKGQNRPTFQPPPPTKPPKEDEFVGDIGLEDFVMPDLPPKDDAPVKDIGKVTKELLENEKEILKVSPLSPVKKKSYEEELEDIIKGVEKEIDTPKNIKGGGRIDDSDRVTEKDFIDKITKQEVKNVIKIKPVPVKPVQASLLDEKKRIRLEQEEKRRRELELEREREIEEAFIDEEKRRILFDEDLEQKRAEFQLYLDEAYPEFSKGNSKNLKKFSKTELEQREVKRIEDRQKIRANKDIIKKQKKELQIKKVERLKKEQVRKAEESNFKVNLVRKSEVHTFFEGDMLLEQREKKERNPDIAKENEVQIKRKEVAELEKQIGRRVVPHRDIVESEESDFDLNSETTPDDILIVVPRGNKALEEYNKLNKLINIRKLLDIDKKEDIDYIKTKNQKPKIKPLFRKN